MLVPHRRDDAEFGERGRAADQGDEALIFVRFQAMRDGKGLVDDGFFQRRVSLSLSPRPIRQSGRQEQARHQSHTT